MPTNPTRIKGVPRFFTGLTQVNGARAMCGRPPSPHPHGPLERGAPYFPGHGRDAPPSDNNAATGSRAFTGNRESPDATPAAPARRYVSRNMSLIGHSPDVLLCSLGKQSFRVGCPACQIWFGCNYRLLLDQTAYQESSDLHGNMKGGEPASCTEGPSA